MVACEESSDTEMVIPTLPTEALCLQSILTPSEKFNHLPAEVVKVVEQLHAIRHNYIATLQLGELLNASANLVETDVD
ncbi:MAG: hypothetical protein JRG71_12185 [Deltaproteobacteria bacterium]|nr:hypothetical protein [Deltaproteobacteria bacterium]